MDDNLSTCKTYNFYMLMGMLEECVCKLIKESDDYVDGRFACADFEIWQYIYDFFTVVKRPLVVASFQHYTVYTWGETDDSFDLLFGRYPQGYQGVHNAIVSMFAHYYDMDADEVKKCADVFAYTFNTPSAAEIAMLKIKSILQSREERLVRDEKICPFCFLDNAVGAEDKPTLSQPTPSLDSPGYVTFKCDTCGTVYVYKSM